MIEGNLRIGAAAGGKAGEGEKEENLSQSAGFKRTLVSDSHPCKSGFPSESHCGSTCRPILIEKPESVCQEVDPQII